ncbi:MAG: DUF4199 domain-containing protein [Alistipes sp.]|nr:DUF4199 domain-containing protein [Alistipes sp.]
MERKIFWNEAAKCGAVLGALLAVSFVLENWVTTSGRMGLYYLLILELVAVVGLHFWLLLRFTRKCSAAYSAEEGFTFGQGYGCVLAASAFAGVIVGVVQAVYLHLIVGYANYIDRTIAGVTKLLADSGSQMPASMEGMLAQSFKQLQSAPVPSVLQTVWGGFFSTVLFGIVFGLIVAAIASRAPRPFDETNDDTAE